MSEQAFYVPTGSGTFAATPLTAGPWSATAQHAGPPSGLLTRAVCEAVPDGLVLGRVTVDLLGPVPVGEVAVSADVLRSGRSTALVEARLVDVARGRDCAVARAWALPRATTGPGEALPLGHGPDEWPVVALPEHWGRGYIDAVEWRGAAGHPATPGPATVWMRPSVPLVAGTAYTGVERLMTCIDSASGISSVLDVREWTFMNTELTVTIVREPVGDWVCVDAVTTLAPTAVGMATSTVHDVLGVVAHSSQTLLVLPR